MAFLMPLLFFVIFLVPSMAYADITGKVVVAESGEPIEGAVVLVEWTVTKGIPGMTNTESLKVVEAATDQEGKFNVDDKVPEPKPDNRWMAISRVNPPKIVIYQSGFIVWRNDFIFPSWKKREDFKSNKDLIIRLEKFGDGLSHNSHYQFLSHGIMGSTFEVTPKYSRALSNELELALKEMGK